MRLRLKTLFHKGKQSRMTQRGVIHLQLTLTSKTKLFIVYWYSAEEICSSVIVLSSNKLRQVFSFPLCVHSNDGCHGRHQHWPCEERPVPLPLFISLSLFPLTIIELFLTFHPTEVAVMFKCRTTWNTLAEILSALHLALFLCSVWSQVCTILCWIFSSEESSIKGALIIHDARFRFVPHCSETENSPVC